MNYKCLKNWHYFLPILPIVYFNKIRYKWNVKFSENCAYTFDDDDALDVNKLVGVQETINPRIRSMRVGWRWNTKLNRVDLFSYKEVDHKFDIRYIATVCTDRYITIKMIFKKQECLLIVDGKVHNIDYQLNSRLTFMSLPYFGGNKKAPHEMCIDVTNI